MKYRIMNISGRLLSALAVLMLVGISCSSSESEKPAEDQPITVDTQTAEYVQGTASHRFSGTVSSDRTINMSTKVMGRIAQLEVEEGDYVSKGDVLIQIKDDNLQAQMNQVESSLIEAKAALSNTETNYNRIKNLYEQESATQKELDDISTQYEMAKAKVQMLESKLQEVEDMLDYTRLTAPFNGYVISKMVSEGDMASPGQPIIALEQEGIMKVNITVPESNISLFSYDDTVSVDIKAVGYNDGIGVVKSINQAGNRGSRQFAVEVMLPELDKDSGIKSGMFAQVGLVTEGDRAIVVPKSAIVERGQLTGLYTLNDNSEIVLRWVRLGDESANGIEILSGLSEGELYVASIDQPLREGRKVSTQ
ncbi:efflux RND transporter periplasmic adaptor subunit [Fodinibius halophilus]|uniref:Efflux RND transporter periplasmic adaptor subunit n=1 Tax=Fodinibius halophilus TaxID=1736908 RepID=A0A6M1T138_9BACT|nr:efflux RND transporter periplasmic adaptor subunit [Fodinibius halophilus]NGP87679.1 efflux RND transporter periplasmic adaptor subunit [Fodinibius halophilus]